MNELNLKDKIAVITGGAGLICSEMAQIPGISRCKDSDNRP